MIEEKVQEFISTIPNAERWRDAKYVFNKLKKIEDEKERESALVEFYNNITHGDGIDYYAPINNRDEFDLLADEVRSAFPIVCINKAAEKKLKNLIRARDEVELCKILETGKLI